MSFRDQIFKSLDKRCFNVDFVFECFNRKYKTDSHDCHHNKR